MTTYSLDGFYAVFDTSNDTIVSAGDATMDFVWFEGAAATLRYDYTGSGLTAVLTTLNAVDAAVSGAMSIAGNGLLSTDEVFTVQWDHNGVTRETTILARLIDGADLDGPAANRSLFGVFALGGDPLPPMPTVAYFARFMLTQIDATSYALPTGDLATGLTIDLDTLDSVTISQSDVVTGTAVAEILVAGAGADTLLGKGGDDDLSGQGGDDLLSGGQGNDTLAGGAGVDTLSYLDDIGASGVTVSLATGLAIDSHGDTDTILGFEHLQGSARGDTLTGDSGDNLIIGYGGNDSLEGGDGADTLTGGAGNDILKGQGDTDSVDYALDGGTGAVSVDLSTGRVIDTHGDTDQLYGIAFVLGSRFGDQILGGSGQSTLWGQGGADTMVGGTGDDSLFGGAGTDILTGQAGADTLNGGDGEDTLSYRAETGTQGVVMQLAAGMITDTHGHTDTYANVEWFEGSDHDDQLWADTAGSQMDGAGGDDLLRGDVADDALHGGAGNDTLTGGAGEDAFDGGGGIDVLDYSRETGTKGVSVDLSMRTGTDSFGHTDTFAFVERVIGTTSRDTLVGDALGNLLSGGDHNDQLYGKEGNDSLVGGAGNDTLGASTGDDTLRGGIGDDVLGGGTGNDHMFGGDGRDDLSGGEDNDTIEGGAERDSIAGGYGDDWIYGGDHNDQLSGSYGDDVIYGDDGNDNIGGGNRDDKLFGGAGDDTLAGGSGSDELTGNSGNDYLTGGDKDDTLKGGTGQDTLRGGPGFDILTGGADADLFDFGNPDPNGQGIITDFELGVDLLRVNGFDAMTQTPVVSDGTQGGSPAMLLDFNGYLLRLEGIDYATDLSLIFAP